MLWNISDYTCEIHISDQLIEYRIYSFLFLSEFDILF